MTLRQHIVIPYIIYIFAPITMLACAKLQAKEVWTLQKCIDYALSHNSELQRKTIVCKTEEINISTSKNSRLPNLSGTTIQDFSFGRSLSNQNLYVNTNVNTTRFVLAAELPLFTGFRIPNTVRQSIMVWKASVSSLQAARDKVSLDITEAYAQVLYTRETMKILQLKIDIDSLNLQRTKAMIDNGISTMVDYAQLRSTLAQSRLSYTESESECRLAVLKLLQLMEMTTYDDIILAEPSIEMEKIPLENPETIYRAAEHSWAKLQEEEQKLKAAAYGIKVAKSYLLPSLSLSGGVSTMYYNSVGHVNETFNNQIKNNFNQYITLNLSVPIFNRLETRNKIRKAKMEYEDQLHSIALAKKELYSAIQNVYCKAVNARARYASCCEAVSSAEASFQLLTAKYERGRSTVTELNESESSLIESKYKQLQAKYEYVFNCKLLQFYKWNDMTATEKQ